MGSHLLKTGTATLHVREALPSSFTTIRKDVLAEKHLLFSEAHPSHFHKKQKEAAPVVPASYFFPYSKEIPGRLRQGISDCSFPRKTRRRPGGVFRQKFPLLSCRGISVMSSRRDSRRILRMVPRRIIYFSFSSDFFSFNGLIFTLPPLLEEAQPIQVLPGFRETIFFSGSESSSSLSESFFSTRVNSSS